jgi:outer membrane biosynthesis protein TonB
MRLWWTIGLLLACALRVDAQHSVAYVNGNQPQWKRDLVYIEAPAYPAVAKRRHVQGGGRFRVSIDINTGRVTNVSILKSTGYGVLDGSATRPQPKQEIKRLK